MKRIYFLLLVMGVGSSLLAEIQKTPRFGKISNKEMETAFCPIDSTAPGYYLFEDRKSTRLNSSHVRISYAVFCLKKKMVFEYHVGGVYCRHGLQVFELFLDMLVPGGLGVEAEVADGRFPILSVSGLASVGRELRHPSDNLNLRFIICTISTSCLARHYLPSPRRGCSARAPSAHAPSHPFFF